jgi:hypothetical protein
MRPLSFVKRLGHYEQTLGRPGQAHERDSVEPGRGTRPRLLEARPRARAARPCKSESRTRRRVGARQGQRRDARLGLRAQ